MKTLNFTKAIAKCLLLAVMTGYGFTACSDDDSDENVLPDKSPKAAEAVDLGLPSGTKWANMDVPEPFVPDRA